MINTERFQRLLSNRPYAIQKDNTLFKLWEEGRVPTTLAIKHFKMNNYIKKEVEIGEKEFTDWMRSLGYIREA